MRGRIICGSLFVLVLVWCQPLICGEIKCKPVNADQGTDTLEGKLVRVDSGSVTLAQLQNHRIVKRILQVGKDQRHKAAPLIGKTVNVVFRSDAGQLQAILFSPCINNSHK